MGNRGQRGEIARVTGERRLRSRSYDRRRIKIGSPQRNAEERRPHPELEQCRLGSDHKSRTAVNRTVWIIRASTKPSRTIVGGGGKSAGGG